jgi:hypothetical protein
MISRIWLINVLLAVFVAFFGFRAYGVWSQERPDAQTNEKTRKPSQAIHRPGTLLNKRQVPPEKDYAALINQNLFSSERIEVLPEDKEPAKEEKKLYGVEKKNLEEMLDKMILYGLVITDDSAKALVSDVSYKPVVRMGRKLKLKKLTVGKTKWVKSGDTVGEFEVTKIESDRIGLRVKGNDYHLLLYDKEKLKPHASVKQKGGPIIVGLAVTKSVTPEKPGTKKARIPGKKPSAAPQPQFPKKSALDKKDLNKQTR